MASDLDRATRERDEAQRVHREAERAHRAAAERAAMSPTRERLREVRQAAAARDRTGMAASLAYQAWQLAVAS